MYIEKIWYSNEPQKQNKLKRTLTQDTSLFSYDEQTSVVYVVNRKFLITIVSSALLAGVLRNIYSKKLFWSVRVIEKIIQNE